MKASGRMKCRAVMLGALAMLAACNPRAPVPSPQPSSAQPNPSATASGIPLRITGRGTPTRPVHVVSSKLNRKQYDLLASSLESNGASGSARVHFKNVRVTFYDKDGSILTADAPRAVVDQTTNTVELLGGVQGHNSAGMTLSCDTLVYDHTTEMVHGQGHVKITNPNGFVGTGQRFDSDISLTHTRMQ